MKKLGRFEKFEKSLSKLKGNVILAKTPCYQKYFEEFLENVWRINLFLDLDSFNLNQFKKIKKNLKKYFKEYNLIFSIKRLGAIEFWSGNLVYEKSLLFNLVLISKHSINHLWEAGSLINRKILNGEDFVWDFVNKNYEWKDILPSIGYFKTAINYCFLNNSLNEKFRIGILKSNFLNYVSCVLYCKGRIPSGKEKVYSFFKEKFNNKKLILILDKIYLNKYKKIEEITKDVIYFENEVWKWKGLNFSNQ